jgi:pyruvate/2-oxoglutarate dehydrogenase complex dihydrolipoamide dehydrogenase (E3) component
VKREIRADFAVVGAGSGGLSVAAGAAQLGQRVVLFEKGEMGGDCLNVGCVPSKALIAAAHHAHSVREGRRFGIGAGEPEVDFAAVMAHVRGAIAAIEPHDSQQRFESLGVTVVREAAAFVDERTLESASVRVTADRVVLATGSRPQAPPVPGLEAMPYLDNESVWGLQVLPRRLIVLGGGPIGLELGQAFARLGSDVVVVEADSPLGKEDPDLVRPVTDALAAEGVRLVVGARAQAVEATSGGVAVVLEGERLEGSHLLVAAGRAPNVEGLNLEAAGVAYTDAGVTTDRRLRTSNRRVYAVGDVTGRPAFTHAAGAHAALVIRKTLFAQRVDAEAMVIPRVTYTDPPLAAVGLTEAEARERHGEGVRVLTVPFEKIDRAQAEGDVRGFAKLVADRRGRVLGVGIVGRGADELIQPWVLALSHGLGLRKLASGWIPPYPTRGDINRQLASQWYQPVLFSDRTRRLVSLLKRFG